MRFNVFGSYRGSLDSFCNRMETPWNEMETPIMFLGDNK